MDLTIPEPLHEGQGWQRTRSSACLVRLRVMQTRPNSLKESAFEGDEGFRVVDDDIAAGLEPDFSAERFVEFVLDAELFEDGLLFGIELDATRELRLKAADEFGDLAVLLFAVNPDSGEIIADVI